MSTTLCAPLARRGFETIAIDMPEYGLTASKVTMHGNAGHYPPEQPGLQQMVAAAHGFCMERAGERS